MQTSAVDHSTPVMVADRTRNACRVNDWRVHHPLIPVAAQLVARESLIRTAHHLETSVPAYRIHDLLVGQPLQTVHPVQTVLADDPAPPTRPRLRKKVGIKHHQHSCVWR